MDGPRPGASNCGRAKAALGGKVCVPPFDTPYGRISVVEDPFGAVFSIITLSDLATSS